MRHILLLLPLLAAPFSLHAEKGQSIMFGDPDPIYAEPAKKTGAEDKASFCQKLRQEMKELEGKPQRRNAVAQRYQLECRDNQ
jgi:hypothetical protein